jgi:hypothetical protein
MNTIHGFHLLHGINLI